MKALAIILLLTAFAAHAAQPSLTIPEGVTVYGPFSANVAHRRGGFSFERTSLEPTFTSASFVVEYSTDKAKTWKWMCALTLPTTKARHPRVSADCPYYEGATHIRVTAAVIGGTVGLKAVPAGRTR